MRRTNCLQSRRSHDGVEKESESDYEDLTKRIAINVGGGYVPGISAVTTGAAIQDGFDGLLFPERYLDGGLAKLSREAVENLSDGSSAILKFNVRCALQWPSTSSSQPSLQL